MATDSSALPLISAFVEKVIQHGREQELVDQLMKMIRDYLRAKNSAEDLPIHTSNVMETPQAVVLLARTHKRSSTSKKYRCPFCRRDEQFYDGWVGLFDNKLRLIGHNCKERHVDGEILKESIQQYRQRMTEESMREITPRVLSAIELNLVDIEDYLKIGAGFLDDFRELRIKFEDEHRTLAAHLLNAVQMHRAILGVDRRSLADNKISFFPIATLRGAKWFLPGIENPLTQIKAAKLHLKSAHTVTQTWQGVPRADLYKQASLLLREGEKAQKKLLQAIETLLALTEFFSGNNLTGIRRWCENPDSPLRSDMNFTAIQNGFRWFDAGGNERTLILPASYRTPNFVNLEKLDRALAYGRGVLTSY